MALNGGKIALLSDEGSIFGIISGRYSTNGHVDLDIFLHGHSGGFVAEARIGRATPEIRNARLTMGLAVVVRLPNWHADTTSRSAGCSAGSCTPGRSR